MYDDMPDDSCEFCRIVQDDLAATKVYHDEDIIAFEAANPQAPVHVIIIPRKHIKSMNHLNPGDEIMLGSMMMVATMLATQYRLDDTGYKILINTGAEAEQHVPHLHVHLLGGQNFAKNPHISEAKLDEI